MGLLILNIFLIHGIKQIPLTWLIVHLITISIRRNNHFLLFMAVRRKD